MFLWFQVGFFCGFSWFQVGFHGFHGSRLVFIVHVENTLKLYFGLNIQSRPCRPKAGFGLVNQILNY